MKFTEYDLDLEMGGSGWVAEQATLSAVQRDLLLAGIRHPVPAEKQFEFAFRLDRLFAETVHDLDGCVDTTDGSSRSERVNSRKPTTLVRDELTTIGRIISKTNIAFEELSPDARNAVVTRLRVLREAGGMYVSVASSFRLTWGRIYNAFTRFHWASQTSSEVEGGTSKAVRAELRRIENLLDKLTVALDDASLSTRIVLERSFDGILSENRRQDEPVVATGSYLGDALAWISFLKHVVDNLHIEVNRGRDEVNLRRMVRGLAALYHDMTGEEPARIYYNSDTNRGDLEGEAGDFLEFVRAFTSYVYQAIPHGKKAAIRSMAWIVRDEIEERKAQG